MKRSRAWLLVPLLSVGLVACQAAAPPPAEEMAMDTEAAMAAIDELRASFVDAVNAQDTAGVMAAYTEDAVLMPPGEAAITGRDAIGSHFEEGFAAGFAQLSLVAEEVEIGDGWAWERGTGTVGMMPEEGDEMVEEAAKYLTILEQADDGAWLIARDIWNANPAMGEMGEGEMGEEEGMDG